jgi:hypothetical protein
MDNLEMISVKAKDTMMACISLFLYMELLSSCGKQSNKEVVYI